MKLLYTKKGLPVLFRHMDSALVEMRYYVLCGSVNELIPSEYGLCHALEHTLFCGTNTRNSVEIKLAWDKLGAYYNAFTDYDHTAYVNTVIKKNWQESYEILVDMFYNANFPKDRWEDIEKGAIISEIQRSQDNHAEQLQEATYSDAFGENYHPILGDIENIQKASVDDLKKFYEQHYCGNNVVFVIAGDLSETQVLRTVERHDKIRKNTPAPINKVSFGFNSAPVKMVRPVEQALIAVVKPIPFSLNLRHRIALSLGLTCLEQYLFTELREKRGLCYGVYADVEVGIQNNFFLTLSTATDLERLPKMQKALKSSLENFVEKGLTNTRIACAKAAETFDYAGSAEKVSPSADVMWDGWKNQIYSDPFDAHLGIMEKLDNGTVRRAMTKALEGKLKIGTMTSDK
jgi:predicted Zn-dependent peptidase